MELARCDRVVPQLGDRRADPFGRRSSTLTITERGDLPPGKESCISSYTFITGIDFGNVSGPGVTVCICSAGAASASSAPAATIVATSGCAAPG